MSRLNKVKVGQVTLGGGLPFVLIAGPCVIENRKMAINTARKLKSITSKCRVPFIFKASYDKANRTSVDSFRGPGIEEGLDILDEVKRTIKVPVLSDVHSVEDVSLAAKVLDIIQIPAFLCRQTDLLLAAGESMKVVNIKKGQFLAPWDIENVIRKVSSTGNNNIIITERGVSFGYNNLVSDFRSLAIMSKFGYPVVFDATHSVQQPGGLGDKSGGNSEYIPLLSRAAIASGCEGLFWEVHPNPGKALSDGPNMLPIDEIGALLTKLKAIDRIVKGHKA
ncbi:MAG: 3-deoxy-8-phosphooctulonate synthase [Candidatus Omnitrophica bacterium]|nr:3-deoxy-8-phosphooctulonate synthase [Candidatus Omnitrophota bacterium]